MKVRVTVEYETNIPDDENPHDYMLETWEQDASMFLLNENVTCVTVYGDTITTLPLEDL